ncbi:MAG TPA: hypothetical protein PLU43_03605, partial [Lachnospiraceae bacterium]|nr:hypothetical protein [Lachnospiraceae bacterium]
DLGGAEQPYWNSYYYLKEALKTQTPKVIVLDITTPGIRAVDFQPENWVVCNIYGMHWNKNKYDALKVSTLEQSFERLAIPLNTIHGRYDELTKEDFTDTNQSISYKGFDPRETVTLFETPDISDVTKTAPISEKAEKYLRKIIELTKEENIPLLMISAPYVVTEDAQMLYNYVFDIADESDIAYIDFNKPYEEMDLDFQTDMAENLHLNESGNEKFSKYLGECLLEKYEIPDRCGNSAYISWETDAINQRQEEAKTSLENTGSISEYLPMLLNKNYIVYLSFGDEMEDLYLDEEVRLQLNTLGISDEKLCGKSAVIVNNGNLLFQSDKEEFKAFISEGTDRLLYFREPDENDVYTTGIYINEDRYAMKKTGISILVYDRQLKQVVDHVNFNIQNGFSLERQ